MVIQCASKFPRADDILAVLALNAAMNLKIAVAEKIFVVKKRLVLEFADNPVCSVLVTLVDDLFKSVEADQHENDHHRSQYRQKVLTRTHAHTDSSGCPDDSGSGNPIDSLFVSEDHASAK